MARQALHKTALSRKKGRHVQLVPSEKKEQKKREQLQEQKLKRDPDYTRNSPLPLNLKPDTPQLEPPLTAPHDTSDIERPSPASIDTPCPLPLTRTSSILLYGEGDLSFSISLHQHYHFSHLTPTVFDSLPALTEKYPQSNSHIQMLKTAGHTVFYSVDATKPPKHIISRAGSWDGIIFLFPHVGGLTKDVDRQVRANQELLLGFFKSARSLVKPEQGVVIMTTFVGEPYESWDVRQLARSAGFRVRRSGRWEWELFPGYRHARTLGNVVTGGAKASRGRGGRSGGNSNVGVGLGERAGWRGEERAAKMWIFEVDDGSILNVPKKPNQRSKRKRQPDSPATSGSED